MRRKYMLIQHLKVPVPEHAEIETRLRAQASDVKQVFTTANRSEGGVVAYMFTTDLPLREMSFGPLMKEDRLLVVELTGRHVEQGLNIAHHWLQSHRDTGDGSE